MSHQVLARKWRPRTFDALVGQEHVVRALNHALSTGHIHHAYLFTGTRGVGKTTIARILAKAVNCETGMTATPCGKCGACTEIDQGRFVDYLELDAASNRGVDEMAQLLDNAVYAPTAGRFKVYMIDEVHMLTAHAFNAMLKTLEEPPPHVLFILATTDPQKVPVTVLSRCMQFNLRNMRGEAIAGHLAEILTAEQVSFEVGALDLIGRAAAGSMRDGLSLLDQAIAYGGGRVEQNQVRDMLGTVDADHLDRVFQALADGDPAGLVAIADEIADQNSGADSLLAELARAVTDLAVGSGQAAAPDSLAARWQGRFDPTDLQVFYQILIHARRDLPLAPDVRSGLAMGLLRLAAFSTLPGGEIQAGPAAAPIAASPAVALPAVAASPTAAAAPAQASPPTAILPASATAAREPARPENGARLSPAAAARAALAGKAGAPRATPASEPASGPNDDEPAEVRDSRRSSALRAALAVSSTTPPPQFSNAARAAAAPGRSPTPGSATPQSGGAPAPANESPASEPAPAPGAPAAVASVPPASTPTSASEEPWDERWADESASMAQAEVPGGTAAPSRQTPSSPQPSAPTRTASPSPSPAGQGNSSPAAASAPGNEAPATTTAAQPSGEPAPDAARGEFDGDWPAMAARMALGGRLGQFMQQSELIQWHDHAFEVRVPIRALAEPAFIERIATTLADYLGAAVELTVSVGAVNGDTAAARDRAAAEAALAEARATIEADPFIKTLLDEFDGQIVPDSIRVVDNPHERGENRA